MAKAETTTDAAIEAPSEDGTPDAVFAAPKRSRIKLLAIGGVALTVCLGGGGYFAVPMALAIIAPTSGVAAHEGAEPEKATEEASAGGGHGGGGEAVGQQQALPVATLVLPAHAASDYQIVSIYDGEAYLATAGSVIRVKVGSTAPGLGDIIAIESSDSGGTVQGSLATLKTS